MSWEVKSVNLAALLYGQVVAELGGELFGSHRQQPLPMRAAVEHVSARLGAPKQLFLETFVAWQDAFEGPARGDASPAEVGRFIIMLLTAAAGMQKRDGMPVFEVPPGRMVDHWLSRRIAEALKTGTKPADEIDFFPVWGWARARTEGEPNRSYALF